MLRHADKKYYFKGSIAFFGVLSLFFFLACSSRINTEEVDKLNALSYAFHYRNLDSTAIFAKKALALSSNYSTGKAEAYNNLAFVCIARMEYDDAYMLLDSVLLSTDNQIELLVADIQYMRLCQRKSKNKDFYDYLERAQNRLKRINEDISSLSEQAQKRLIYAKSEFSLVSSTYYYYVGLTKQSVEAINQIDPYGDIQKDTAQYLNYLYQVGSGGIINAKYQDETAQKEFERLFRCYMLARKSGLVYWEANSLQSVSEHLLDTDQRVNIINNNPAAFRFINEDNMPDSLLSGYLAQKSLELFSEYGDVYQIAGAYRTLSFCYWNIGDYTSSLICLEKALDDDKVIEQAPELVASIREHLSLVYSAMDDKNNSDINRNEYLDLQDKTRQDMQLEARAEQLEKTSMQLNILIVFIIALILICIIFLFLFRYLRKNKNGDDYVENLLLPLRKWEEQNNSYIKDQNERYEELNEQLTLIQLHIEKDKRRNLDNKAKIFLVTNVVPYIDRIINEVRRLRNSHESEGIRNERFAYMAELTDRINEYNNVLTHWIQLQQGQLSLHIETFSLEDVFDILAKSAMSFQLKGITLNVEHSDIKVKADKILTLFMLNTLADNARKFTPAGGCVDISAKAEDNYVEISVKDTGKGLTEDELSGIFDRKVINGHGFGLMNCKGIMDKYRKVSHIFDVCGLFAESKKGKGSRFYFRLPYGISRLFVLFFSVFNFTSVLNADDMKGIRHNTEGKMRSVNLVKAGAYADSAYYSNINGTYMKTLDYADSVRLYLNRHYKSLFPKSNLIMVKNDNGLGIPAEIKWFRDGVNTDYGIILDIRNESAVAALALHEWDLYKYNNKIYTQLFKEKSADKNLAGYCLKMQRSSTDKTIAVIILVLLLGAIVCSYYFMYYRHVLFFRFCMEHVDNINAILLSDLTDEEKQEMINNVDFSKYPEKLKAVIIQIRKALQNSVELNRKHSIDVELAEDELHRYEYEDEKLYISNNVIDNCLSTLKHETMYYPSRIRQLVDDADKNIRAIEEVAVYYKELYSILCEQVRRQAATVVFDCKPIWLRDIMGVDEYVLGDKALLIYLFDILKKHCGAEVSDISVSVKDEKYLLFHVSCHKISLTSDECMNIFTPTVGNIPFLICRHIVRENTEQTNLHGCGITAWPSENGKGVIIRITLARASVNGKR